MLLLLLACTASSDTQASDSGDTQVSDTQQEGCPAPVPLATEAPASCPELEQGLNFIEDTPGSPYLVSFPGSVDASTPTLLFLPGGPADRPSAEQNYMQLLGPLSTITSTLVVVPYVEGQAGADRDAAALRALKEIQGCLGADRAAVHLIGHSSGGRVAYPLAVSDPGPFASLTGVPGVFDGEEDQDILASLACIPVHNIVGDDDSWKESVQDTHTRLEGLGLGSTLTVVPDMGHIPGPEWDGSLMQAFWDELE